MREYRPRLSEEEYKLIQKYRGIIDASEEMQLDHKDVKHGWLKTKTSSLFFKNPNFEQADFDPDLINWEELISDIKFDEIPRFVATAGDGIFDRLVITDAHIGMSPNPDGNSLYGGKWDEEELERRLDYILDVVIERKRSGLLVVDDLGDLMDGWNGETIRKHHSLPQNMTNQEAFNVALKFKIRLLETLAKYYDKIISNNISNDNHSGAFGYVVNSALKSVIGKMTDRIDVNNHSKFIVHYQIRDNVFIISHGKDDKNMKFGFKPFLDKAQMEKIDNYIDQNYLLKPNVRIEFSKGDSHQLLFDHTSSDRFDYFNYMALSPASNWIQTNYKKGKSGFTFFNFLDTDNYIIHHIYFKWIT